MNRNYQHRWQWLVCIIVPSIIELLTSYLFIFPLYGAATIYPLVRGSDSGYFDLAIFLFSTPAWLYSVYTNLRHDVTISRSLLMWPLSIFKWARKNPIQTLIVVFVVSLGWKFLSNPEVDISQLKGLESSFYKISEEIEVVVSWTEKNEKYWKDYSYRIPEYTSLLQKFSTVPSNSDLPQNSNELETLRSDYQHLRSFADPILYSISQLSNSVSEKSGILNDENAQISKISEQLEVECQKLETSREATNNNDISRVCNLLPDKIATAKGRIEYGYIRISSIEDLSDLIKSQVNISSNSISAWERKILELEIKFQPFDISTLQYHLNESEKLEQTVYQSVPTIQSKNSELLRAIDIYAESFGQVSIQHDSLKSSLDGSNDLLGERDLSSLLNQARVARESLRTLKDSIGKLDLNLREVEKDVEENSKFITGLKGNILQTTWALYKISISAEINSAGAQYLNLINERKNTIDALLKGGNSQINVESLYEEVTATENSFNSKKRRWFFDLGQLKNSVNNLEGKNEKFIYNLEFRILLQKLMMGVFAFIVVASLALYFLVIRRRAILRSKSKLTSAFDNLMSAITNPSEYMQVRLDAVNMLENEYASPQNQDVELIKKKIRVLEKSKSDDDVRIAAELRRAADTLEYRLSEQREI
jgi:cell shape-determining protein MreC